MAWNTSAGEISAQERLKAGACHGKCWAARNISVATASADSVLLQKIHKPGLRV